MFKSSIAINDEFFKTKINKFSHIESKVTFFGLFYTFLCCMAL